MKSALKQRQERIAKHQAEQQESLRSRTAQLRSATPKSPQTIGYQLEMDYRNRVINPLATFTRSLKTRDENNIRIAYALHLFTRYPVPKRIQSVWLTPLAEDNVGRLRRTRVPGTRRDTRFANEQRECFFVVGSGGSAFKLIYRDFLSKKEVHRFLNCRYDLDYARAIVFAIAKTFTDSDAVALRIAQSKVGERDYHVEFWRDAVRFFAANPIPLNEINDLVDYLTEARNRNADFSLKGRSLISVTNLMRVWHREMRLVRKIGHHKWEGLDIPNWEHEDQDGNIWTMTQLLTGKALAEEGAEMHHCVYSYQYHCSRGGIGIFSLKVRRKQSQDTLRRALTIEVNENAEVRQVRGFANRMATLEEDKVVREWKTKFNLRNASRMW